VILGISAAVGSLIPLVRLHPEAMFQRGGLTVLAGVALVLVGVALAAVAGRRREAVMGMGPSGAHGKGSVMMGLLFATISGLGSALVNFGLAFGGAITSAARHLGANPLWAPNAVWMPLMVAGGIPNLIYCVYLMRRNSTAPRFRLPGSGACWLLAAVMAFCWYGSTVMYGVAATQLGDLGPVLGWPLFMSLIVITATAWGVGTGEWKHAGKHALRTLSYGVGVLVLAIFVLGVSSRMF
jgi:L-rhamnose-H+ transport protein